MTVGRIKLEKVTNNIINVSAHINNRNECPPKSDSDNLPKL